MRNIRESMIGRGNDCSLDAVLLSDVTRKPVSRNAGRMIRSVGTVLIGAAAFAALAGCAYQESFGLPDLTPSGAAPGAQVHPGYGYGFGYGYGTGYPGTYQPGYGNAYGYASPYYRAQGPYPYGYGYAYEPIPRYILVACPDSNRDGRCDSRPPKQHHGRDPHDHDDGSDQLPARPRPGHDGEVPRARDGDNVAPAAQQRAVPVPATVRQPPAQVRPEARGATPLEAANQRGPRVGSGRPSMAGDDSSRPMQDP